MAKKLLCPVGRRQLKRLGPRTQQAIAVAVSLGAKLLVVRSGHAGVFFGERRLGTIGLTPSGGRQTDAAMAHEVKRAMKRAFFE